MRVPVERWPVRLPRGRDRLWLPRAAIVAAPGLTAHRAANAVIVASRTVGSVRVILRIRAAALLLAVRPAVAATSQPALASSAPLAAGQANAAAAIYVGVAYHLGRLLWRWLPMPARLPQLGRSGRQRARLRGRWRPGHRVCALRGHLSCDAGAQLARCLHLPARPVGQRRLPCDHPVYRRCAQPTP